MVLAQIEAMPLLSPPPVADSRMDPSSRPTPRPAVTARTPRRRKPQPLPQWALGVLLGVFIMTTALAAYLIYSGVRDVVAGWNITAADLAGPSLNSSGQSNSASPGNPVNTAQPSAGTAPAAVTPARWAGTNRVTILLLGIDRRVGDNERGYRTDSVMVVSVDPVAKTAVMLSVPRDLWVEIPGYGNDRINQANYFGDIYQYPGGGPALAVKTIEHNLGVTIDYYLRVDFTTFEAFINALGGVDIDNPADINDPLYPNGSYGYDPFYLTAGRHTLNGYDALRYARTRHDDSDINRATRQQQVILAARDKALAQLPNLLAQSPALYQTLQAGVQTNMSFEQMTALALLAPDIPRQNIQRAVIDYRYVLDQTTADGRQVLVPLRDKIRELRDELFTASAALSPRTGTGQAIDLNTVRAEAARVEVLNGAGVQGLAKSTGDWLTAQGLNVVGVGTADRSNYPNTVIVDYTGKPQTAAWLAQQFGVASVVSGQVPDSPVDVRVILGADWQVP